LPRKDGTLIRSTGSKIAKSDPRVLVQLMEEAKRHATRSISIRVPIADLEQCERTGSGRSGTARTTPTCSPSR